MSKSIFSITKDSLDKFCLENKDNIKDITLADLSLLLYKYNAKGNRQFVMLIETEPKMNKGCIKRESKACPKGEYTNTLKDNIVKKVAIVQAFKDMDYANRVNIARGKEGLSTDFQAQQNWHTSEYEEGGSVKVHATRPNEFGEYLSYSQTNYNRIGFTDEKGNWYNEADEKIIVDHLPEKSVNKSQGLSVENQINYQVVKLKNIRFIKLAKQLYRIIPVLEPAQ